VVEAPPPERDLLAADPETRGSGWTWLEVPLFVVRVVAGIGLVGLGAAGLLRLTEARVELARFDLPDGVLEVQIGAGVSIVLGVLLILGFLTRVVALVALIVALIAVVLVGRPDAGLLLVATSAASVMFALLVWLGGGMLQIVNAVDPDPR
jgi:uncharacterized membrane protein YphA (DoxX/SURF4 family)